jgi:hypothetical protein
MASLLAWWAWSAFCLTVVVSSSIEEAVSSSEAACCSVRADRSMLVAAISLDALAISSVPMRTLEIIPTSFSAISCIVRDSRPGSPPPLASARTRRSPSAMRRAACTASCTGRVTSAASHRHSTMATPRSAPRKA